MPLPAIRFTAGTCGKILDPIHPGREVQVACGDLRIPFEAFETEIAVFEISGFAYAADAPHFPLSCCKSGRELQSRYLDVFHALQKDAPQTTRKTLEPGRRRIIITKKEEGSKVAPDQP
jgi:hypothetical protein